MKKEYVLTFCISFLILATVVIISLMILIPQHITTIEGKVDEYLAIKKSDYTFKQTNSISFDNLTKDYTITDAQIKNFRNQGQYVPGNSDPFTANEKNNTTSGSSSNNSSNNNTSTQDKITNSNGGVKNPSSTNK